MKYILLLLSLTISSYCYSLNFKTQDTCKINCKDSIGLKQGEWQEYYQNNKTKSSIRYKNDTLNGEFKQFFISGKIEIKGTFKKGKKDGEFFYYNPDGSLRMKIVLSNGNRVKLNEYYNNKVKYEEFYKNGKLEKIIMNGEEITSRNHISKELD